MTSVHADIKAALVYAGINAVDGPADDLPTVDGLIGQAAVLWPSPGLHAYTRASGTSSGRSDRVLIQCVGAMNNDALAVADAVEEAVGGMVLSPKGGTLRQVLATEPVPEPNADPRRVAMAVIYEVTNKGGGPTNGGSS
jgi:hypothetical protein